MTRGLVVKFGNKRVRGTPISEAAFVGLAAGAAMTGLRPIVEMMYMDFSLVAMDQLINQAAKISYMSGGNVKVPMVIEDSLELEHQRQRSTLSILKAGSSIPLAKRWLCLQPPTMQKGC